MRVLLTGATGFIGGHLIPKLLEKGYEIIFLSRDKKKAQTLKESFPSISDIIGDTTQIDSLQNLPLDVDYIIHLAAMGHVSAISQKAFDQFISINEGGTKNLIEYYRNSNTLKKFVHFSSTAAMGPAQTPLLNEKSTPNPVTPYQKSKLRSEIIVQNAVKKYSFPAVIVRPCMVYGVGGYGEFYKFCRLMRKGIFPKVGLGQNLTPLVYVDDVADGALLAMENGNTGEVYLIASQTSIPMDTMRKIIVKNIGCKVPYIYVPSFLALAGAFSVEKIFGAIGREPIVTYSNIKSTITDRTFDISKASSRLGYVPQMSFEKGIRKTIEWYRENNKI